MSREDRYQAFVSEVKRQAEATCPGVTEEQIKIAFLLRHFVRAICVQGDPLYGAFETREFIERFEAAEDEDK